MAGPETNINPTPKSPELLQAQVAVYAGEQVERETPGRERTLLANLDNVALYPFESPEEVTYPSPVRIQRVVDGEFQTQVAKGQEALLFTKSSYTESLKRPGNRELSRTLADMMGAYDDVASAIDALGIRGLDLASAREHPNFLANGGSNMAFWFEGTVDGSSRDLVALLAQDPEDVHAQAKVNRRAISLARARGLHGFEQGIAVSYDPPVVVAEMAKGTGMASLTLEDRQAIPAEHWDQLMNDVVTATERGISVDTNSDNFLYDPDGGFTVIDFRTISGSKPFEDVQAGEMAALNEFKQSMLTKPVVTRN